MLGQVGLVSGPEVGARLIQLVTRSAWNHTVVAISDTLCIGAEPGGATIRPIRYYTDGGATLTWSRFNHSRPQAHAVARWAVDHIGVDYDPLDFLAAGVAAVLRERTPRWVLERALDDRGMICSRFCDLALQAAGIRIAPDEPPAAVTPATFGREFHDRGWAETP